MQVVDFLREDCVLPDLVSPDKVTVLRELVDVLAKKGVVPDAARIVEVLLERELLGSTGIGDGVAIPHGKLPGLVDVVAVFGRSRAGVPFDSMDGEPVHIFILLLAPEDSASLHLKALARIARVVKSPQFRQEVMDASGAMEIYGKIAEEDGKQ